MGESAFLTRSFSHPSTASREANEGDPLRALTESISFGRFMSESLAWEKWSTFSHNRYLEEVEQFSKPGSVAQKKAFFEAHYKKRAAMKAAALLEQANATVDNAPVVETAGEPHNDPPKDLEVTNTTSIAAFNEQQECGVFDTELTPSTNAIIEQEIGVSGTEATHPPSADEFHESGFSINSNVERFEGVIDQSVQVENSKLLDDAGDSNMIPATPEKKISKEETAEKESVGLPSNKRQMNSSTKPPSQNRASKLQKFSVKQASSMQPKTGTHVAPNNKKPVEESIDKKRLTLKSVHMSINLGSRSGDASKSSLRVSKDGSATPRNPTRASVYGVLKFLPSIIQKQSEDRRSKSVLNKSVSGETKARGTLQSSSRDCSISLSTSEKKARCPIMSLPFSLKSEERAAKRKEFFQKLEERNNAKEAEKAHQFKSDKDSGQSAGLRAKPSEDLHRGSHSSSVHAKKIPLTRPRSPKLGRKPMPSVVQETSSRPPRRPSVNNPDGSKCVGRKGYQTTTGSGTLVPKKKKAHENASPNIQL